MALKSGMLIKMISFAKAAPKRNTDTSARSINIKILKLTMDFKQEANGNSGVFFHSSIDGTTISGWQAEVAPPGLHTGGIYESYGRGWLIILTHQKKKF